jgi:prolipoprotein diacylglyceryltransferase
MIFLLGVGGYCIGRFIIDFWRQEDILFLRLKPGQIASLVVLIGVLATFVIIMIRRSNAKKN